MILCLHFLKSQFLESGFYCTAMFPKSSLAVLLCSSSIYQMAMVTKRSRGSLFTSERLQEEQQTLEEQCERRIEMLTKSMKKSRKRKKIDRIADDDDSYVSSVLLHAEKVKVKVRQTENHCRRIFAANARCRYVIAVVLWFAC